MWLLCKLLEVSRQGFYAWLNRKESKKQREDAKILEVIKEAHEESDGTYGSPRLLDDVRDAGFEVGRRRVARLMKVNGIVGIPLEKWRVTTESGHNFPIAPNILRRQFSASRPNELWVGDITYIGTHQGWMYLAVVIDLFSRRVVGWSMQPHLRAELAIDAIEMAIGRRCPEPGLTYHTDRGIQYAADAHRSVLVRHGIEQSMSRKGDCWDNAVSESFFATLKRELIRRYFWHTRSAVDLAVTRYIEMFYNARRRHSFIGNVSPVVFEREYGKKRAA
jgi:transposase InsO family protein